MRARQQAAERAEREVHRERREAEEAARRQADQLQREAGAESTRSSLLAVEVGKLEEQQRRLQEELRRETRPAERQALEQRLAELRKKEGTARQQMHEASAHADALLQKARKLVEDPPETDDLRRARAEQRRTRQEAEGFYAQTVAPLEAERERLGREQHSRTEALAREPEHVRSPVEAVYTYGVEHHRLAARAAELVTLVDHALGEERLRLEASSERVAEDTTFPGARVRGEPDLYLPPDPLELPSDELFERDLVADLASRVDDAVARALADHRSRFAVLAARSSGERRLSYYVLAWRSGVALDGGLAAQTREAILEACGYDLSTGMVLPERLDP
ncbi:MAG: hypothetical protein QM765_28580 [Myxococcales bacterium]